MKDAAETRRLVIILKVEHITSVCPSASSSASHFSTFS
jgi:hypothetical protein